MSSIGWKVVHAIDHAQREVEAKRERDYWQRYSNRLTPQERRRIGEGDHKALARPVKPDFEPGQWLQVSPKLAVRVVAVVLRRRGYRVMLGDVQDFRGGRVVDRRTHEDPANMTTIVPINDWPPDPPEPEKVPAREVSALPTTIGARARYEREWQERRMAHESQPLEIRLASLRIEAQRSGVDVTRQMARIEQGVEAAESKVRRLSKSASDRAA